jgi:S-formylglutathione hydrolase FrmB
MLAWREPRGLGAVEFEVDIGTANPFYVAQLCPEVSENAATISGHAAMLSRHDRHDHSCWIIRVVTDGHLRLHARETRD